MAQLFIPPARILTILGVIAPQAKMYFYLTGTSTAAPVYQDEDLDTAHSQPVVADIYGQFPAVYFDPATKIRVYITTSADVEIDDIDPYNPDSLRTDLAATTGANLIKWSHAETYTAGTVGDRLKRFVVVTDPPYLASTSKTAAQNTAAIQDAIDDVSVTGGIVYIPAGTFSIGAGTLGESLDNEGVTVDSDIACLVLRSGVYLKGAGMYATKLDVSSNGTLSGIFPVSPEYGGISDLELDGNWNLVNGTGHGILQLQEIGSEYCKNFTVERCYIHDFPSYGIGIENGDIENLNISNNRIYNVGADGIDIKGRGPSGGLQPAIRVTGNHINSIGIRANLDDQTGIDIRGFAFVGFNHIEIVEPADGNVRSGIRCREVGGGETYGGARTRIVGNYVSSDAVGLTRLIYTGATETIISGNLLIGGYYGIRAGALANVASRADGNVAINCTNAYFTDNGSTFGSFSGNTANDCTTFYNINGDGCLVTDSRGQDMTNFWYVTGDNNACQGGKIDGTVTTPITNSGTGNTVAGVFGIRTKSRGQSSTFAVDSTGVRTVTIAHSLNSTIAAAITTADVVLSLSSAVSDWVATATLASVDATNLNIKVNITTASATGSSTGRVTADINTERL